MLSPGTDSQSLSLGMDGNTCHANHVIAKSQLPLSQTCIDCEKDIDMDMEGGWGAWGSANNGCYFCMSCLASIAALEST